GKDPDSQEGQSPTLFATDRTDRRTYIAQGWIVTDPQVLADVGPVPDGEAIIEIPEDVLKFYQRRDQEGERGICSWDPGSASSFAPSSTPPSGLRHATNTNPPTRRRRSNSSSRVSRLTWPGSRTGSP